MKKVFLGIIGLIGVAYVGSLFVDVPTPPDTYKNLNTYQIPENSSPFLGLTGKKQIRNITLKSNQVIRLLGEVGSNIEDLIDQLNKINEDASVKAIYLLIDSPGGSVLDGAKFVSAIEASKKPIFTVCTTICASMAAIIHQYGTKRLMTDRSVLMFHDAAGALQGPLPQMRTRLNFFDRLTTKMDAYIAQRAGTDLTAFLASLHTEVWIDAEDATAKNFNDEIVYVTIEGSKSTNKILDSSVNHSQIFIW